MGSLVPKCKAAKTAGAGIFILPACQYRPKEPNEPSSHREMKGDEEALGGAEEGDHEAEEDTPGYDVLDGTEVDDVELCGVSNVWELALAALNVKNDSTQKGKLVLCDGGDGIT